MIELEQPSPVIRACLVETELRGERLSAQGTLEVRTGINPAILCRAEFTTHNAIFALGAIDSDEQLPLYIDGSKIGARVVAVGSQSGPERLKVSWQPNPQPITILGCPSTNILVTKFTVANFPNFISSTKHFFEQEGQKRCAFGLLLEYDGFRLEIIPTKNITERVKRLRENCGYMSTHRGRMERIDGAEYTADVAIDMLHGFFKYLSFVRGIEAKPVLPTGFNATGGICWEWLVPPARAYSTAHSLFDSHAGKYIENFCPLFLQNWFDPKWRQALGESVSWYLECNSPTLNKTGAIVLIQAALERLSFFYLVECTQSVSRNSFRRRTAGENVAAFLRAIDIPIEIPVVCDALADLASANEYEHSPHAITSIRNQYVHPRANRNFTGLQVYDASNLAMWLVEMAILKLCGYEGKYSTRLESQWIGQYKDVPWENEP